MESASAYVNLVNLARRPNILNMYYWIEWCPNFVIAEILERFVLNQCRKNGKQCCICAIENEFNKMHPINRIKRKINEASWSYKAKDIQLTVQWQPEELKIEWNIQSEGKYSNAETLGKNPFRLLGIDQQPELILPHGALIWFDWVR